MLKIHKQKIYFRWPQSHKVCTLPGVLLQFQDLLVQTASWHFSAVSLHHYPYYLEYISDGAAGRGGVYFKWPAIYCLHYISFPLTFKQCYWDPLLLIYNYMMTLAYCYCATDISQSIRVNVRIWLWNVALKCIFNLFSKQYNQNLIRKKPH